MIPDEVLKAFDNLCYPDRPLIWVSTSGSDGPHLAPVCFVKSLGEDVLLIGNVFIRKTASNIRHDPRIAVGVAFQMDGWDGYLLKGTGQILDDGPVFEGFKREVLERTKGKRVLVSAVRVRVERVYSLKPGSGDKRIV